MLNVSRDKFEEEVIKSEIPVVVDFWAFWCVPCKQIESVLEELSSKLKGKVKFVKVNIEEFPDLASSYMVMSIPTLIVFNNGIPSAKKTGSANKSDIEKFILPYIQ